MNPARAVIHNTIPPFSTFLHKIRATNYKDIKKIDTRYKLPLWFSVYAILDLLSLNVGRVEGRLTHVQSRENQYPCLLLTVVIYTPFRMLRE